MQKRTDPPGTKTIAPSGDIAGAAAVKFCQDVEKMQNTVADRIVVDLRNVTYMDSCGLGGLIYLRHLLTKQGKKVALLGVPERVRTLFHDCNVDGIFETVEEGQ